MADSSFAYCAFLISSRPNDVKSQPVRPWRVGITQSNKSMPRETPSRRSSGVPTPIRYRGAVSGNSATDISIA